MQTFNAITHRQLAFLLVEDDEVDVMNVKRALKKNNLDIPVNRAMNGLEALEMLHDYQRHSPSNLKRLIVLLDLNMPKMGGLEFLKVLRSDPHLYKLPVIVLTTSDQAQDLEAAYELNVAGYVIKPVEFPRFVEIINVIAHYWSICLVPE